MKTITVPPNFFSTKTEYVQTCFRRENDPSCRYGVKHPTLTHSHCNTQAAIHRGRSNFIVWGLPLITYAPRGRGWVKPPIHFYCVLHAKRGEGVQVACKIAYVINGRPLCRVYW